MAQRHWPPDPELAGRLASQLAAASERALAAPWPEPATLAAGVFARP